MTVVEAARESTRSGLAEAARAAAPSHVTSGRLALYALPVFGVGFFMALTQIYFLKFATDVLLVTPGAVGLVFAVAKVWDAVSDPLAGCGSDRTRSPWGRRRPWIAAAAVPMAAAAIATWAPPHALSATGTVLWLAVSILGFYTAYTAFNIPHLSLGAELAVHPADRMRLFGAREIVDKLGLFAALGAIFWLESSPDPRALAPAVASVGGAFLAVSALWVAFGVPEPNAAEERSTSNPVAVARAVLRNRSARLLLGVFFLEQLGFAAVGTLLPYASEYVLETPGWTSGYLLAFVVPILVSIPVWLRIADRIGKLAAWAAGLAMKAVAFAVLFLVPAGSLVVVLCAIAALGAAHGAGSVIPVALLGDIAEADRHAAGERRTGSYFATWNLAQKIAMGLALALAGLALDASGFVPNTDQTSAVRLSIRIQVAALPCLWSLLALALLGRLRIAAKGVTG